MTPQPMIVETPAAMEELGAALALQLRAGDLVLLNGELGAGKTTLTRGVGAALGVRGAVTSPTFVLARTHPRAVGGLSGPRTSGGLSGPRSGRIETLPPLVHVDAYRLSSAAELDDLDIDFAASIVIVEWGAGLTDGITDDWLEIDIARPRGATAATDDAVPEVEPRTVTITAHGARWQEWANAARD